MYGLPCFTWLQKNVMTRYRGQLFVAGGHTAIHGAPTAAAEVFDGAQWTRTEWELATPRAYAATCTVHAAT